MCKGDESPSSPESVSLIFNLISALLQATNLGKLLDNLSSKESTQLELRISLIKKFHRQARLQ